MPLRQKNKQNENILNRLINHEMLTAAEKEVLINISNGSYTQVKSAFDRLHDAQHQHENFLVLEVLLELYTC
jgi:hypothetical protein